MFFELVSHLLSHAGYILTPSPVLFRIHSLSIPHHFQTSSFSCSAAAASAAFSASAAAARRAASFASSFAPIRGFLPIEAAAAAVGVTVPTAAGANGVEVVVVVARWWRFRTDWGGLGLRD